MAEELLLWTDFETTGVDHNELSVLEVAFFLTDMGLQMLGEFTSPVLEQGNHVDFLRLGCSDEVRVMHDENGLWEEVQQFGMALRSAERYTIEMLKNSCKAYGIRHPTIYMAGNGVAAFDRRIVRDRMTELDRYLHYRTYDVSQMRRFAVSFLPGRMEGYVVPESPHRGMPDIQASIHELRLLTERLS